MKHETLPAPGLPLRFVSPRAYLLPWVLAIALTALAVALVGENPLQVLKILATSAFGGTENISYTLFFAAPMLLTGTAVTLALEAGLFNIGAEGQLYGGALGAIGWGILVQRWFPQLHAGFGAWIAVGLAVACSFLGGALVGAAAGYLRARRQVHEVIATIMLNFIVMAFANWAVLGPFKNPETQSSETLWVPEALRIPHLWQQSTLGLPLGLFVAALALWALRKTWWGFRVRATGKNEAAAALAGIRTPRITILTLALSGGVAGLVGFHEVYCNAYRLIDAFSPGYGFTGLAIALLARGRFSALLAASLLFAALHKGTLDLDLETEKVTRDLAAVIQALILVALCVARGAASKEKTRK